ncbi:MAG: isocitrate lyase/PEP mutase family protein [Acidimicrobiales bacterium]
MHETIRFSATEDLAALADHLRALHTSSDPLVLVNVWDAASAQQVGAAGGRAIATSSAAVAASLGVADDNTMGPTVAFDALRRVCAVASVPVTADLEGGYGLGASELVESLLAAGAVGCNIEDSDHRRPGTLLDAHAHAERLGAIREAAHQVGVGVVLNARIDTLLHASDEPAAVVDETIERARLYAEAGADCVYPVSLTDPQLIAELSPRVAVALNVNKSPSTSIAELGAAGASRISVGPMAHTQLMAHFGRRAAELLGGGDVGHPPVT